jgi:hypothetical protein
MVLERHIVCYSEYNNKFLPSSQFLYISIHRVRGHHVFYIHYFYINFTPFFATPPTLADIYINGGGGCCLPFGVCFHQ